MPPPQVLTGHAESPFTGAPVVSEREEGMPLVLTSEQLPRPIVFGGRRYVLRRSQTGGLVLNGA